MSGINTNHTIYLKVLTPLHIGGAQEKHLQDGLDFIRIGKTTWKLNWERIYRTFKSDKVADAIVSKTLVELLESDIENVASKMRDILSSTGEVKAFIRDGFGRAYIPGSSIKGALKNWLYSAYDKNPKGTKNLFGSFDTDLFRFIKSSDCYMNKEVVIYPTKTFNLHKYGGNWEGGWKHKFKSFDGKPTTSNEFKNTGFVTDYECFKMDNLGSFSLSIHLALPDDFKSKLFDNEIQKLEHKASKAFKENDKRKLQNQIKTINNGKDSLERFYDKTPLNGLFKNINAQLKQHIERELAFFENYKNAEGTEEIINAFENLKNIVENINDNQCVLRLSAGSGFHGMTGDYQFTDHVNTGFWDNGKVKLKSRKIAFTPNEMFPMGFVLLSTVPFSDDVENKIQDAENKIQKVEVQKVDIKVQTKVSSEIKDASTLKQGDFVFGEIVEKNKPFSKVKLMLNNYDFDLLTDLAGLKDLYATINIGQIVKCKINSFTKDGKISLVKYIE